MGAARPVARKGRARAKSVRDKEQLTEGEAFAILRSVGIGEHEARRLVPIGNRESELRPKINNAGLNSDGSVDHGWLQINDIWANDPDIKRIGWNRRYDPIANARMAKVVLRKQGLGAWATHSGDPGDKYTGKPDRRVLGGQRGSKRIGKLDAMSIDLDQEVADVDALGQLDLVQAYMDDRIDTLDFVLGMEGSNPTQQDSIELPGTPGVKVGARRAGAKGKARRKGAPQPKGKYQGTKGAVRELGKEALELGLQVTSAKRQNTNPYSGSGSDHDHGNTDAYAWDMSNGDRPTPEMDEAAYRIAKRLGIAYKKGDPIMETVVRNGIRYQLIYRGDGAAFGGNHMDHVHLGAKRVG